MRKHAGKTGAVVKVMTEKEMLAKLGAKPCPNCGGGIEDLRLGGSYIGYSLTCDCYDGAPDSRNRHLLGYGETVAETVDQWNQAVELY